MRHEDQAEGKNREMRQRAETGGSETGKRHVPYLALLKGLLDATRPALEVLK